MWGENALFYYGERIKKEEELFKHMFLFQKKTYKKQICVNEKSFSVVYK